MDNPFRRNRSGSVSGSDLTKGCACGEWGGECYREKSAIWDNVCGALLPPKERGCRGSRSLHSAFFTPQSRSRPYPTKSGHPAKKIVDPDFHNAFIIPIYLMKEMFGWTDEVPHDENEGNEGHFTYEISHSDSFHLNLLLDDLSNQWPVTIEYIYIGSIRNQNHVNFWSNVVFFNFLEG